MFRHLTPRVGRGIDEAQWAALTTPLVAWSANHQSLKKITSVNAVTVPKLLRQLCPRPPRQRLRSNAHVVEVLRRFWADRPLLGSYHRPEPKPSAGWPLPGTILVPVTPRVEPSFLGPKSRVREFTRR